MPGTVLFGEWKGFKSVPRDMEDGSSWQAAELSKQRYLAVWGTMSTWAIPISASGKSYGRCPDGLRGTDCLLRKQLNNSLQV